MAELIAQDLSYTGTELIFASAAGGGDSANFAEDLVLIVKNDSGADKTVTIVAHKPCNQGALHDQAIVVTAGESRYIGPFDRRFIDTSNKINWTYSAVTSVTVAAFVV